MTDVLEVSPVNTEEYRLLHTMIRVTDIDKSIEFYTNQLCKCHRFIRFDSIGR